MHDFLLAFMGGIVLGVAVVGYLYINGRVAGISGLLAQVLQPQSLLKTPALWFVLGLLLVPFAFTYISKPDIQLSSQPWLLVSAGLLVGFGTRLGSGCTSGHGICGISRLSKRSIVATLVFMLAGILTVYLVRHLF